MAFTALFLRKRALRKNLYVEMVRRSSCFLFLVLGVVLLVAGPRVAVAQVTPKPLVNLL